MNQLNSSPKLKRTVLAEEQALSHNQIFSVSSRNHHLGGLKTFTAEILISVALMCGYFLRKTLSKIGAVLKLQKRKKKEAILRFQFLAKITAHQRHENEDFRSKRLRAPK